MYENIDFEVESTCRICLENSGANNIFSSKKNHTSKKICKGDGLPSKLCRKCFSRVSSAYKLKILAEKSYEKLKSHFIKESIDVTDDKYELKQEIKDENEIKKELDEGIDNILVDVSSLVKDESLEKVIRTQNDIHSSIDTNMNIPESDYDDDDNTPLVFYSIDDIKPNKGITKVKKKRGRKKQEKAIEESLSICHLCGKQVKNMKLHSLCHDENRRRFPCGDCPKVFFARTARKRHRAAHHLGMIYFCEICNKNYKRGYDHIRIKHSNRPKLYACLLCDKRFLDKSQLTYHVTIHTKERAFSCDVCGKAFRTKALCSHHRRRVHDKEKKNICQYCSKGFFSPHHLQIHLRSHTKEKNYKCKECEKCFSTSSGLLIHSKRHAGIKNSSCQICSKEFVCQGALKTHMISHTKEKKHSCRYCGVKFGRTDHRNRHEKTAHENKQST